MGMGIKIFDRQCLHMGEHLIAQIFQCALGNNRHNSALAERRSNTDCVETSRAGNGMSQTREIIALLLQQRKDVIINELLHKQCSLHVGENTDKDTKDDHNDRDFVILEHIAHNTLENLARVLDFWPGAARTAGAGSLDFLCFFHHWSPPFWSKSPEPFVWLA